MRRIDTFISETEERLVDSMEINRVRWFYKEDGEWVPFYGCDSLKLEKKYRQIHELDVLNLNINSTKNEYVLVRGNMYKASIFKRRIYPIFWIVSDDDESVSEILRGTWFQSDSNLPLDKESIAEAIESHHLKFLAKDKIVKNNTKRNFAVNILQQLTKHLKLKMHSVTVDGYVIEWVGINDVYLYTPLNKPYFFGNLEFGRVATRIIRGYHQVASELDKLSDVTHLCFVIPEIRSPWKSEECLGNVYRLNKICEKYKNLYFSKSKNVNSRVEFLVLRWHKRLLYDCHAVGLTIPLHYQDLRKLVNNFAMNIFQYANPIHHKKIIQFLKHELNRLYLLFCHYNENFVRNNGKVSVITESISSVLMFDMLANHLPCLVNEELKVTDKKLQGEKTCPSDSNVDSDKLYQEAKNPEFHLFQGKQNDNQQSNSLNLSFEVQSLFNLGSPLAIFLFLHYEKGTFNILNEQVFHPGICKRFFNVLHPADLTVYRIEPLINASYVTIDPIRIPKAKQPYNSYLFNPELFITTKDDSINSSLSKILNLETSGPENSTEKITMTFSNIQLPPKDVYESSMINKKSTNLYHQKDMKVIETRNEANITYSIETGDDFETSVFFPRKSKDNNEYNDNMITSKNNMNFVRQELLSTIASEEDSDKTSFIPLKRRIDYELQDRALENSTVFQLGSCDSYWESEDFLIFILNRLCCD